MKVNLQGLFTNAVNCSPSQRPYYRDCLKEVYGHLQSVAAGKHTFQEFADHYCIRQPSAQPKMEPAE